jgi:hypothetical protein
MRIVNPMPRAVPPISIENDADVARNRVSLDLPDEPVFICSIERSKSPDRRSSPEPINSIRRGISGLHALGGQRMPTDLGGLRPSPSTAALNRESYTRRTT